MGKRKRLTIRPKGTTRHQVQTPEETDYIFPLTRKTFRAYWVVPPPPVGITKMIKLIPFIVGEVSAP